MKNILFEGRGGNKLIASEKLINVYLLWPIRLSTTRLSQRVYKRDFCSHVFGKSRQIYKSTKDNKLSQFSFKVMYRIITTRKELLKYKLASDDKCPFCLN